MNDAIDSRLEALAFQYVSFGLFTVASNLWTLVAVVTAAVSVWSIRAAAAGSSAARSHPRGPTKPAPPHGDGCAIGRSNGDRPIPGRRQAVVAEGFAPTAADDSSAALTSSANYPGSEPGDGVTRGRRKFTAYYKDDGERKREAVSTAAEEEDAAGEGGSCGGGEWWESWERVLKARNGAMWWYRCQDTGVINGAVVRLWDESRCGSGKRDSSGWLCGRCRVEPEARGSWVIRATIIARQ